MRTRNEYCVWGVIASVLSFLGCTQKTIDYYTVTDFNKVPKIDAHFHYNTKDIRYLEYAGSLNFRLISPNVDAGVSIDDQLEIARTIKQRFPDKFFFLGTFSVDGFNNAGFAQKTIARIDECMNAGASGIKIWKNIGMEIMKKSSKV